MTDPHRVLCFGEILWDCLPQGLFLGGAPLNVAYHLRRLGAESGMLSRIGADFLGEQAAIRAKNAGIDFSMVGRDAFLHTGFVDVSLDENGDARYEFPEEVAWDVIHRNPLPMGALDRWEAIVFGSLALRRSGNRDFLATLLRRSDILKVLDVNVRPPFSDRIEVVCVAALADVIKMNTHEAYLLVDARPGSMPPEILLQKTCDFFMDKRICITFGEQGAGFATPDQPLIFAKSPRVHVVDTIGAGDAFTAALTLCLLKGGPSQKDLEWCCKIGALVASKAGGMPFYEPPRPPAS